MTEGLGRICAVAVTYNIGEEYLTNFNATKDQVDKIIIVDNGSDEKTRSLLKKIESEHPEKVEIIYYARNYGLAYAQNAGVKRARDQGFNWLLLLDHDSAPAPDMVDKMAATYEKYLEKDKIAIIAPCLKDVNSGQEMKYVVPKGKYFFAREGFKGREYMSNILVAVASGSLIKTSIFEQEGYFIEDFFIDYIDVEYCLRLISKGWKILAVRDAILNHAIGKKEVHNLFGMRFITSNHSPQRRHYIYKNRCFVWKKYLLKTPSYIIYDIFAAQFDIFRILMFEKQKVEKLYNIYRGALTPFRVKVNKNLWKKRRK